MSNLKHTPGPWIEAEKEAHMIMATNEQSRDIALIILSDVGQDEANANTALIIAAPELLEALQAVLPYAENWTKLIRTEDFEDLSTEDKMVLQKELQAVRMARAAIIKATIPSY